MYINYKKHHQQQQEQHKYRQTEYTYKNFQVRSKRDEFSESFVVLMFVHHIHTVHILIYFI